MFKLFVITVLTVLNRETEKGGNAGSGSTFPWKFKHINDSLSFIRFSKE